MFCIPIPPMPTTRDIQRCAGRLIPAATEDVTGNDHRAHGEPCSVADEFPPSVFLGHVRIPQARGTG